MQKFLSRKHLEDVVTYPEIFLLGDCIISLPFNKIEEFEVNESGR